MQGESKNDCTNRGCHVASVPNIRGLVLAGTTVGFHDVIEWMLAPVIDSNAFPRLSSLESLVHSALQRVGSPALYLTHPSVSASTICVSAMHAELRGISAHKPVQSSKKEAFKGHSRGGRSHLHGCPEIGPETYPSTPSSSSPLKGYWLKANTVATTSLSLKRLSDAGDSMRMFMSPALYAAAASTGPVIIWCPSIGTVHRIYTPAGTLKSHGSSPISDVVHNEQLYVLLPLGHGLPPRSSGGYRWSKSILRTTLVAVSGTGNLICTHAGCDVIFAQWVPCLEIIVAVFSKPFNESATLHDDELKLLHRLPVAPHDISGPA
eukprot:m.254465 g.254465  ORF g.254465 m.254465 type:complete len:321 (-) comp19603_c0_seq19:532-1494(-)